MFFGFLDFGIFKFLDFWVFGFLDFCVLHLCFQTVETAPKLDSEKTAFVSAFTVSLRGVRVAGGWTMYIYIYIHTRVIIYLLVYSFIYVCII